MKSGTDLARIAAKPFPVVKAAAAYRKKYLWGDIPAGLVEGIMKVPSGEGRAS